MKTIIGIINPNERRKHGHQEHVTGTGAHIDKKKYSRKTKHRKKVASC